MDDFLIQIHRLFIKLSNDINKLNQKKYFTNEINKDKSELNDSQTQVSKNMREKLFVKKKMKIFFF